MMATEASDEVLVGDARTGDAEAFGRLLGRHYDMIFRIAFRMLGHRTEAEDLTQDVCVSLPRKLENFRGDAQFTTWLYRVVVNASKDKLRERTTRRNAWRNWGELEQLRHASIHERRQDLRWLRDAMSCLSSDLRETIALVLDEGMTHTLAADLLGVSEGTVSWRMSEVRRALRALAHDEEART